MRQLFVVTKWGKCCYILQRLILLESGAIFLQSEAVATKWGNCYNMGHNILFGNMNPVTGALDTKSSAKSIIAHKNSPAQGTGCPLLKSYLLENFVIISHGWTGNFDKSDKIYLR